MYKITVYNAWTGKICLICFENSEEEAENFAQHLVE